MCMCGILVGHFSVGLEVVNSSEFDEFSELAGNFGVSGLKGYGGMILFMQMQNEGSSKLDRKSMVFIC